jgi:hypothetical protein
LGCQLKLFQVGRTRDVLLRGFRFWRLQVILIVLWNLHMLYLFRRMMVWLFVMRLVMGLVMLMMLVLLVVLRNVSATGVVKRASFHCLGAGRGI